MDGWVWHAVVIALVVAMILRLVVLVKHARAAGGGCAGRAAPRAVSGRGEGEPALLYTLEVVATGEGPRTVTLLGQRGAPRSTVAVPLLLVQSAASAALDSDARQGRTRHLTVGGNTWGVRVGEWARPAELENFLKERDGADRMWLVGVDEGGGAAVLPPLGKAVLAVDVAGAAPAVSAKAGGTVRCYALGF